MGATLTAARSRQPSCPRPKRVTEEEKEEEAEAEEAVVGEGERERRVAATGGPHALSGPLPPPPTNARSPQRLFSTTARVRVFFRSSAAAAAVLSLHVLLLVPFCCSSPLPAARPSAVVCVSCPAPSPHTSRAEAIVADKISWRGNGRTRGPPHMMTLQLCDADVDTQAGPTSS